MFAVTAGDATAVEGTILHSMAKCCTLCFRIGEALDGGERLLLRDVLGAHGAGDGGELPADVVRGGEREHGRHGARVGPAALQELPHHDLAHPRPIRLPCRGPCRRGVGPF